MAKKRINLALQGGGAHGAFTWGVLDRLLMDEDLEVAAISGTSAGALNGAAFKAGMIEGGREGARDMLEWLWKEVGARPEMKMSEWMAPFSLTSVSSALENSWPYLAADAWSRVVSPYAYGPFYTNPLRPIVSKFNYDEVCAENGKGPCLFVCATRVRSGKIRVFKDSEISTDVILASACLPTMFQAVPVTDPVTGTTEDYWDGGYTGNPALFPLFNPSLPEDIVVVNINPLERVDTPRTAQAIQNRINEISFNSSLLREMRAIHFVQRLLDSGRLESDEKQRVLMHMIADDALMNELSVATKVIPTAYTLAKLKEAGQRAADDFLSVHRDDLNKRSSVDMVEMFQ
ncbi:patatin [Roseobacter denitrificans]|uniref:Phospholipase patatin-like family, putative n=1 Tax=Roseobacter denitrificans (strain ATCC 33942 / OCh 114) TaxID=375451 RepID=Q165S2_ROSDO|nr:patatin-like phospholipase family protein [Roseobacter denitrificans]ABG32271.1 phospholipase patatin-like family, putative [Roseobacter denitrificans OCh 114]AVL51759.1 patatin [Roseobacter denitrificans]SFF79638.1 NTE family protein [Roseobacter denitrificans OCh 114]